VKRLLTLLLTLCAAAALTVPFAGASHTPNHSPPAGSAALTIAASPNPLVFGGSTRITGRLTGTPQAGNATVTLQTNPYPYTLGYQDVATAQTAANGEYAFTVRPGSRHRYRVVFGATTSPEYVVRVRLSVSFLTSDVTPRRGQLVRFFGFVRPDHDNRLVLIQRRGVDGIYRTVATTTLRDVPFRTYSYYTRTLRLFSNARYRMVPLSGDVDHLPGISTSRFFTVG